MRVPDLGCGIHSFITQQAPVASKRALYIHPQTDGSSREHVRRSEDPEYWGVAGKDDISPICQLWEVAYFVIFFGCMMTCSPNLEAKPLKPWKKDCKRDFACDWQSGCDVSLVRYEGLNHY